MEYEKIKDKKGESIRRIRAAAIEIFAEVGFAGARVDEIAKRAGVNKAMIYYRIGDKKTLYAEVLHHVFGDTTERIVEKINQVRTPEEKLRIYLRSILSLIDENPQIPRFMMWELASGAGNFPDIMAQDLVKLLNVLKNILNEGIGKDAIFKISPLIPHMMALGAMVFYKISEPLRKRYQSLYKVLTEIDTGTSKKAAQEIEDLILRALIK